MSLPQEDPQIPHRSDRALLEAVLSVYAEALSALSSQDHTTLQHCLQVRRELLVEVKARSLSRWDGIGDPGQYKELCEAVRHAESRFIEMLDESIQRVKSELGQARVQRQAAVAYQRQGA